jgi:hypothetical protein
MTDDRPITAEDFALLRDAGLIPKIDVLFPPREPGVPSVYLDCFDPTRELGYSETPPNTRVVPLSRADYTFAEAQTRFEEMQAEHGWGVTGFPFYTARWWCWRIYEG